MYINAESSETNSTTDKSQELTVWFKALAHPTRLAILDLLRNGEQCVCHLEAYLGCRQAYISQQLSVLREADLIQDNRDGLNIYYRIHRPEVFALIDVARIIIGIPAVPNPVNQSRVVCPCPKCASKSDL